MRRQVSHINVQRGKMVTPFLWAGRSVFNQASAAVKIHYMRTWSYYVCQGSIPPKEFGFAAKVFGASILAVLFYSSSAAEGNDRELRKETESLIESAIKCLKT